MADADLMQKAADFIEENLKADLRLADIAEAAGYSVFHFCRIFQGAVGMPVMQYVLRRRLKHAAYAITCGMRASDAALLYGFDTHAGLYKAFMREYGCSPTAFAKRRAAAKPSGFDWKKGNGYMISREKVREMLAHWQLENAAAVPVVYENSGITADNVWEAGSSHFLKATKSLAQLTAHAAIAKALQSGGMAAPVPVRTSNGKEYVTDGELFFYLLPRLEGRPVNSKALLLRPDAADAAFRLGTLIGRLHKALEAAGGDIPLDEPDLAAIVRGWAMPETRKAMDLPEAFYAEYNDAFPRLYPLMPRQLIHRDIHPGNILMDGENFSGFLDFELGEKNIRLFDPCYCLTGILSENLPYCQSAPDNKWFLLYKSLLHGYNSVCPLTDEEKEAAPYVVFTNQMICVAYFGGIPKYQELAATNRRMFAWLWERRAELVLV